MGSRTPSRRTPSSDAPCAIVKRMRRAGISRPPSSIVRTKIFSCALVAFLGFAAGTNLQVLAQGTPSSQSLTPLQREIERERQRFASSSTEERRDAVMRLGAMHRPDSSRAAAAALHDPAAIARATATHAILSLPSDEAAGLILPLLKDRDEFVRREAAYALGETRSPLAVPDLITLLADDKKFSVRASAAVSLGMIGDERAVVPLTEALAKGPENTGLLKKIRGKKSGEDEVVRLTAAGSVGQIRSRAAVPALIAALSNEREADDVRRESARSLGLIGDPSSVPALRSALTGNEPYLSHIAYEALRKISPAEAIRPA